ncbi:MAG: hypothetical protein ACF788_00925, partial [Novipirellula sp. JB048]
DIAEAADESLISDHTIEGAWAQLQQLPSPMIESPDLSRQGAPVEFGELEDLEELEPTPPLPASSTAEPVAAVEVEPGAGEPSEAGAAEMPADEKADEKHHLVASTMRENMLSADVVSERADAAQGEIQYHSLVSFPVSKVAPLAEHHAAVKDPSVLFGQFDEEEEVCLSSAAKPSGVEHVAKSTPPRSAARDLDPSESLDPSSLDCRTVDAQSIDAQCDELETMLHQEIVGIADAASNASFLALHEAADQEWAETNPHETSSPEAAASARADTSLFIDDAEAMPGPVSLHVEERRASPAELENAKLENAELENKLRTDLSEGSLRLTVHDDSDLLIIEEDVDLARSPNSIVGGRNETEVSVDFHSMLRRMRTGGEAEPAR